MITAVQRKIVAAALLRSIVTMLFVQAYGGDALNATDANNDRLAIQMSESTIDRRVAVSACRPS
jgi:hypothetical protein